MNLRLPLSPAYCQPWRIDSEQSRILTNWLVQACMLLITLLSNQTTDSNYRHQISLPAIWRHQSTAFLLPCSLFSNAMYSNITPVFFIFILLAPPPVLINVHVNTPPLLIPCSFTPVCRLYTNCIRYFFLTFILHTCTHTLQYIHMLFLPLSFSASPTNSCKQQ